MHRVSHPLVTVIETPEFLSAASRLFDDAEHAALIVYLATHPTAGSIIRGTGGIRKVRWALAGRGKRGGARVIYFFHSDRMPLVALTTFAKNEREDLTPRDRNTLRQVTAELVRSFLERGS
jgi:hypothetical protein